MTLPDIIKLVVEVGSLGVVVLILFGFFRLAREFVPPAIAAISSLSRSFGVFGEKMDTLCDKIDALGHRQSAVEDGQAAAQAAAEKAAEAAEEVAEKVDRVSTGQYALSREASSRELSVAEAEHVLPPRRR